MNQYREIPGDLIALAKAGEFDVIAHGCNCFCRMKRGLAPQMAEAFGCDKFPLESHMHTGDINKLGQIDFQTRWVTPESKPLIVVNCYTQYQWGTELKPFDYEAFQLCLRKMNFKFKGWCIGLPQIGAHLAGGNWSIIKKLIQAELADCDVTVVIYNAPGAPVL